eukprot:TRINITY_DN153_c0_g1_i1.p1 TRINITY_DN153_c0_g1~~TRINITY_DN153_c0_g1_i1.p1  ORF type:complete len:116 (-),score=9.30 TRINITY_DN153_c0_g1_i1:39-386(-)
MIFTVATFEHLELEPAGGSCTARLKAQDETTVGYYFWFPARYICPQVIIISLMDDECELSLPCFDESEEEYKKSNPQLRFLSAETLHSYWLAIATYRLRKGYFAITLLRMSEKGN